MTFGCDKTDRVEEKRNWSEVYVRNLLAVTLVLYTSCQKLVHKRCYRIYRRRMFIAVGHYVSRFVRTELGIITVHFINYALLLFRNSWVPI